MEPSTMEITTVGLDLAKRVFQVHGVDAAGGAVLATLGVEGYNPLLKNRRRSLTDLRTVLGEPIPPHALAKTERLLIRLELVLDQIATLDQSGREPCRYRVGQDGKIKGVA